MIAYYNEIDPYAAQWLRNLIAAGHIAPGEVDERSILDVKPNELRGFTQCHFFAGVGVWSYALRRAGWPDSQPVWTGSCPCQPFSSAGMARGFDDERHLWPMLHFLIEECRPAIVFGEQVASKDADAWIELVQTDLEALGYAVGAIPFPSAGVGAPHIRDRLYWVADSMQQQRHGGGSIGQGRRDESAIIGSIGGVADSELPERRSRDLGRTTDDAQAGGRIEGADRIRERGNASGMADTNEQLGNQGRAHDGGRDTGSEAEPRPGFGGSVVPGGTGPTNGYWRDADWLFCRDGKWRPVEPGTFPLAHGVAGRVGRLRAYGNAINAEAAVAFIESYRECGP